VDLSYANGGYGGRRLDNSSLVNRIATILDHDGITLSSVHQGHNVDNGDLATLEQFAQLTGGKVYPNEIEKAVKEVMETSRSGYVIEYDAPRLDGKYHKIRVTCSRRVSSSSGEAGLLRKLIAGRDKQRIHMLWICLVCFLRLPFTDSSNLGNSFACKLCLSLNTPGCRSNALLWQPVRCATN
jgi:hypothetical protein